MNIIKKSARGFDLLPLESQLLENRMIFFTEEVNAESCQSLIQQLLYLDTMNHQTITILINSPGGEVMSGLSVVDVMQNIESPVCTVAMGTCASMGAILFEGASQGMRFMLQHAQLMLHGPSFGNGNFTGMKYHEIQEESQKLAELNNMIADMLSERTNIELDKMLEILSKDSYFNANEALDLNLIDGILDAKSFRKELMSNE